jgi:hypothetical protein
MGIRRLLDCNGMCQLPHIYNLTVITKQKLADLQRINIHSEYASKKGEREEYESIKSMFSPRCGLGM